MLTQAGILFETMPSQVDERALKAGFSGPPAGLAASLAEAKAQAISTQHTEALVIGADQLLVCEGKIFDKPCNLEEAAQHLRALSGRGHELVTAICLAQNGQIIWQHVEHVRLSMRELSPAFLKAYIDTEGDELLHCVGAYRLEGLGAQLFTRIDGDYFTVLGLPLLALLSALRELAAIQA